MDRAGRFFEKLHEQLGFLERSCAHFDDGYEPEAIRLATTMRVLFHDTRYPNGKPNSTSLLSHLSMTNENMLATPRTDFADWRDFLSIRLDLKSQNPVTLIPRLQEQFCKVSVFTWWADEAIMIVNGQAITRKMLTTAAANRDGGAHVNAALQKFYQELVGGQYSLGITGNLTCAESAPFEQGGTFYPPNGHLALLRQFAHEVLAASSHFGWK